MRTSPKFLVTMSGLLLVTTLCAATPKELAQRIADQLQAEGRDRYDSAKDPGRKPVETMQFAGVKSGMTVLDMITGAGYNAEILAAAVGPDGIVYAQNSHAVTRLIGGAHHDAMIGRLKGERLGNVRYVVVDARDMPFENTIDLAFWGTNFHDLYNSRGETAALDFLSHVRRALKPGGHLIVSDHVGVAGNDNAELHRIEPNIVHAVLEKAGFVFEAQSRLLENAADDHNRSIYTDGLRYYTDRFLLRYRKPK